jgi:hypothetical protein
MNIKGQSTINKQCIRMTGGEFADVPCFNLAGKLSQRTKHRQNVRPFIHMVCSLAVLNDENVTLPEVWAQVYVNFVSKSEVGKILALYNLRSNLLCHIDFRLEKV